MRTLYLGGMRLADGRVILVGVRGVLRGRAVVVREGRRFRLEDAVEGMIEWLRRCPDRRRVADGVVFARWA